MKYLSFDAHTESSVLSVRNSRMEELELREVLTRGPDLIAAVKAHRGPKTLIVEESNLAGWLKRTLEPHVTRLIVCNPKKNRSISEAEDKDDIPDARELSYLLGMGYFKEVHHPTETRQNFKDLVLHYHRLTKALARCKIQINAKLREQGLKCQGYAQRHYDGLHPLKQIELEELFGILDATRSYRDNAHRRLLKEARKHIQIRRFLKIDGIGPVRASTFYAIIDNPYRFKKRAKLWAYCGVGLKTRGSAGRVYRQKRNQEFNRYLKDTVMGAAQSAWNTKADNPFKRRYERLLDRGADPRDAHIVVARSVATTLWGMWRSKQDYNPDI